MEEKRIPEGYTECSQFFRELREEIIYEYKKYGDYRARGEKRFETNNKRTAKVAKIQNAID